MDLKLEVYSPALELLGLLEVHRSVIWESKAFGAGSFSLEALITEESRALLVPDHILWIEGDTAGVIEHIQQQAGTDGPYITVKGRDLTGLLDRRILWGLYDLNATPPAVMHHLVQDSAVRPTRGDSEARKLPGLALLDAPAGGNKIRYQKTGGSLLDALELLGEAYQVAFGVRFNAAVPRMEFWTRWGADRSVTQSINEPVFYSTELDDVLESEYSYDSANYRNVSLVAGEGEGKDRVLVTVEGSVEPAPTPPEPPGPTPVTYTITLSVDPEGGGTASGGGSVSEGASVTVTASPSEGYEFSGWREGSEIVSTEPSYTFQASADRSLTAVFAVVIPTYTITLSIDPAQADWGSVSGGGRYQEGSSVTVTATPAEGYQFVAWQEGGQIVSTDASYTFTVGADRRLTAVFEIVKPSRLPSGYTEVEYIHSDSRCQINTGIAIDLAKDSLEMVMKPDSYISSIEYILGSSSTSAPRCRLFRKSATQLGVVGGKATTQSTINISIANRNMTLSLSNGVLKIDTTTLKTLTTSMTTAGTVYLLSDANRSSAGFSIRANLYSCKMYKSGTLKRDFVPCIDPSNAVGLYDLVEGEFYGNSLSGSFTAGPAV